jgi:hypothetical protein
MAYDQEMVRLHPGTVYWMDVSDSSHYNINKMEIKEAKWCTPNNYQQVKYNYFGCQSTKYLIKKS